MDERSRKRRDILSAADDEIFVVWFLDVHPFQDGNGRLSQVLTTLLLLHHGYNYVPYASLESVIEENKEFYYKALRKT